MRRHKKSNNTVFLNRPIKNEDEDWIGISTYVDKLDAAVEANAKIVAVTSDFGTGKSSLISLYKNKVKNSSKNFLGFGKKVLNINMWGTYEQTGEALPLELHKSFIYQLICQINPKDRRKSNYISRRLSKDFGIWALNGKSRIWSIMVMVSLIGFFLSTMLYNFKDYVQSLFDITDTLYFKFNILIFTMSIVCFVGAIINSEIVFSSKKSEGNRTLDENILIDLFKQEVLNQWGWYHYIVVLEDLDRIESKESVSQFLRELRKYYLTEGGRHKITFVVCIKPEAMLTKDNEQDSVEYKKIFDFIINLQKVNIDNYDSVLRGLLEEKREWLNQLNIPALVDTQGMEWMKYGREIDIREIKCRLNETLTLYESLQSRFPDNSRKRVITFEKCAVATYLRREYENDFYQLKDDTLDIFVSQYGIRGLDKIGEEEKPDNWDNLSEAFKDKVKLLVKSKLVDANYRLYFYNYPSESKLFTLSEMHVYNSIVYQEAPKDKEKYEKQLEQTPDNVIKEAYDKISSLGLRMPSFVLDYDKLFTQLCTESDDKFYEMITTLPFDQNNLARICTIIEKCVKPRVGNYERDKIIYELSNRLVTCVEDKNVLYTIRQRMCHVIPERVKLFRCLFTDDNVFFNTVEIKELGDIDRILSVINYSSLQKNTESVEDIHKDIISQAAWKPEFVEFYKQVIECQGMGKWKEPLAKACNNFGEIPYQIVAIYIQKLEAGDIEIVDYVECIESVENLDDSYLQPLSEYSWVNGLSERLCNLLYKASYYLEYICNVLLIDNIKIDYNDEKLFKEIQLRGMWIKEYANIAYDRMRREVLQSHTMIEKYTFLFHIPYEILNQVELNEIEEATDALLLLQDRNLTEQQARYVTKYFNKKYRQPTVAYKIIKFIITQEEKIGKEMFYSLNFMNVPYRRMALKNQKELAVILYEYFKMERNAEEKVRFLHFTGMTLEKIEKNLWKDLNNDKELTNLYVEYVNKLNEIPHYTMNNIVNLSSVYAYSDRIINKLWEGGYYKLYVSSKTMKEGAFSFEKDKLGTLWDAYVEMFYANSSWTQTRSYMLDNEDFMQWLVEEKEYIKADGNNIKLYARAKQSEDLLNYIIKNFPDSFQIEYFRSINGFDGKEAAHRFCEIAKENTSIGKNEDIYRNVKGTLINPGLEGWFTKIWKDKA